MHSHQDQSQVLFFILKADNWWTSYIWWFKIRELSDWLGEALTNQRQSWSTLRPATGLESDGVMSSVNLTAAQINYEYMHS